MRRPLSDQADLFGDGHVATRIAQIRRRVERLAAVNDRHQLRDLVSDGLDDFKSDVAAAIETLKDVLCEHVDCGEVDLAIETIEEEIEEALARFRHEVGL